MTRSQRAAIAGRRFRTAALGFSKSRVGWFIMGALALVLLSSLRALVFPPSSLEHGELVILTGVDVSTGGQRQQLIDRWNKLHPDTPARVQEAPGTADGQHSQMVAAAQSKDPGVDVYNLDVTWISEFAAAHYIRPLGGSDTRGFLSLPLQTCLIGHTLWALPFNTDAGLLYYRTDVMKGIPFPSAVPPSAQDMRAIERASSALAPAAQPVAGFAAQFKHYEGLTVNGLEAIWADGGDVVTTDAANRDRVVADSPGASEAFKRLARSLTGSPPGLLPDSRNYTEADTTAAFAAGRVAMMRNWPVAYGQLKNWKDAGAGGFDIRNDFAVRALPGDSVLGGQDLAVSATTKKPRAAQALIEFLTSETSEHSLFRDGGLPATRADVYAAADVRTAQPYAQTLLDVLRHHARLRPVTTHYPLFSSVFQDIVTSGMNQGNPPPDTVPRLTRALEGQL